MIVSQSRSAGVVESTGGITSDGNARSYTWRAVNNTGSTSTTWAKIATVTGTQSTRFSIHLSGRTTSYSDGVLGAYGYIIGQLNNDDNYDLLYYNHSNASSQVVLEAAQVDVSGTKTDVYIKVGTFAEVVAHAIISDGSIEVKSDTVTSQPASYVVASTVESWNSGNDGSGSGLDADTLDGSQGSHYLDAGNLTGSVDIDRLPTKDEDNMASNSADHIPTQQSVKAYVDSQSSGAVSAVANGANDRIATFSSSDAIRGEGNLTFDGSTLAVTGAITGSSTINIAGAATFQSHIIMGDSDQIKLGAGTDLQIYHDGSKL